ncbi:MAG TPA: response regulator [Gaiellaceae bacterium]|jgi:class 3 adenylate cyclase/CheY-like chemotaxis protein
MKRPKTGTVTFLFTDLEGSTGLAHRLQERWSEVLVEHRRMIREPAFSAGGHEIDCRGDELFVAFEDATAAARCAIDAQLAFAGQEWPEGAQVRVRMGMHTGEAIFADSDYLGVEVHRAARISFAGHGGQILLSDSTAQLLPDELSTRELGEYLLRGLPEPVRIFQLEAPGLGTEFPPLRFADDTSRAVAAEETIRIVLADDSVLLREGIAALLETQGFEVVGQSDDADDLLLKVESMKPDVVIADIRMPPGLTDDGVRAAQEIRRRHPGTGVLLLSQYAEPAYARDLLEQGEQGVGYLLKDRVGDVDRFTDAVRRVAAGELVLDPEIKLVRR